MEVTVSRGGEGGRLQGVGVCKGGGGVPTLHVVWLPAVVVAWCHTRLIPFKVDEKDNLLLGVSNLAQADIDEVLCDMTALCDYVSSREQDYPTTPKLAPSPPSTPEAPPNPQPQSKRHELTKNNNKEKNKQGN